jgi:hypothetical protein
VGPWRKLTDVFDLLARWSRRPALYVVVGLLVAIAVVGPWIVNRSTTKNSSTTTTVAATTVAPTTANAASTPTGPTTTVAEVDHQGDQPNPGSIYPGRPDQRPNDHERAVGLDAEPARLSGFSAWVAKVAYADNGPDGARGPFLDITVRLINRDDAKQSIKQTQWTLRRPDGVVEATVYATPILVSGTDMGPKTEQFAEIWFPSHGTGRYWLALRPDQDSQRGVWAIEVP